MITTTVILATAIVRRMPAHKDEHQTDAEQHTEREHGIEITVEWRQCVHVVGYKVFWACPGLAQRLPNGTKRLFCTPLSDITMSHSSGRWIEMKPIHALYHNRVEANTSFLSLIPKDVSEMLVDYLNLDPHRARVSLPLYDYRHSHGEAINYVIRVQVCRTRDAGKY